MSRKECPGCDTEHSSDIGCIEALQYIITELKEKLVELQEAYDDILDRQMENERLRDEVFMLKKQSHWIPVGEGLLATGRFYPVLKRDELTKKLYKQNCSYSNVTGWGELGDKVEFWFELPEPPEGENDN